MRPVKHPMPPISESDQVLYGGQAKYEPHFNVVLVEPEIPNNTGNIGRTCVGTQCKLHLVGKLGFKITDKNLRRAGLDYWQKLDWIHHQTFEDWQAAIENANSASEPRLFYFSDKGEKSLYDLEFKKGDWLVFGKETIGPEPWIKPESQLKSQSVRIPQIGPIRSLNLANAAAIAIYEGLRQTVFKAK